MNQCVSSTLVVVQVEAPPVGSVEVSTLPADRPQRRARRSGTTPHEPVPTGQGRPVPGAGVAGGVGRGHHVPRLVDGDAREVVGHEIPVRPLPPESTLVTVQAEAPPVGSVDVATLPSRRSRRRVTRWGTTPLSRTSQLG